MAYVSTVRIGASLEGRTWTVSTKSKMRPKAVVGIRAAASNMASLHGISPGSVVRIFARSFFEALTVIVLLRTSEGKGERWDEHDSVYGGDSVWSCTDGTENRPRTLKHSQQGHCFLLKAGSSKYAERVSNGIAPWKM